MPENTSRDAGGRWLKGSSGNPGGRPSGYAELVEAVRSEAPETVRRLVWLRDNAESEVVRLAACRELLDRAYGKARPTAVQDGGEPVGIFIRHFFEPPTAEEGEFLPAGASDVVVYRRQE